MDSYQHSIDSHGLLVHLVGDVAGVDCGFRMNAGGNQFLENAIVAIVL
jgi:hypothetical protein